ncbi:4,5-DOPA dioxygenase extradiol [Marinomonas mediterranea]|uniref:4,5-DOPA-extradiol-dioxygenase n=1 Tax=Marinomonas mediterranea TaxID=119864 RepID=UPI00234A49E3|nr:4,5-DOPA dioxygenase extradiol [Marinomonas mediterranea]WCN13423.1 4,5-DOPA dioxygenase extradiol [Marinomonas mediterranea]
MNRRDLVKSILAVAAASSVLNPQRVLASSSERMPVLFLGHGSPMNALRDNAFTQHINQLGKTIPTPRVVVVVSAHWVANNTMLSATEKPTTIYDFGGFPKTLYQMTYPCDGDPSLTTRLATQLSEFDGDIDKNRGLDHGAWTMLHHLYPEANIPVIQLAMSAKLTMSEHLEVGAALQSLRNQGILIIGSGNIVHNLGMINRSPNAKNADWSVEFDGLIKQALLERDLGQLLAQDRTKYPLWNVSHPTIEHYVPLLYAFGASTQSDTVSFPYEGFESGSISMRSVLFS